MKTSHQKMGSLFQMAYFIIITVIIKKYTELTISKIPTFNIEIFLPYNIMARITLGTNMSEHHGFIANTITVNTIWYPQDIKRYFGLFFSTNHRFHIKRTS